ncbi:chorismate synthase [Peptostreptococcus faecalis]|uniref:chorismate synthase n=1 Tax=Peptostreptococcus faecalis TaxID=2045015 RepID=UPI000C7DB09C|nr:chorismate synthase [Peptostreptococcus faecalis]
MSATWGRKFKVTIFGESHGTNIGVVIDGIPSGTYIDMEKIQTEMDRRAPGKDSFSTARKESDTPLILSGVFERYATGAPLAMTIENKDQKSRDYSKMKDIARPGHADYSANIKYSGFNDYRGGGHFSGRLTAGIVFAGAIAKSILEQKNILIGSHIKSISNVEDVSFDFDSLNKEEFKKLSKSRFPLIDSSFEEKMKESISIAKENLDSLGGVVECAVIGIKPGIGEPFFESVESVISSMMFSIPAVKGIEFGDGFDMTKMSGSEANDSFCIDEKGNISTKTNHNGGINGGITNGMPVVFKVAIKPTPSISKTQMSVNLKSMENEEIKIIGRHDPSIVPRVVPVIEAATAIAILDCVMIGEKNGTR